VKCSQRDNSIAAKIWLLHSSFAKLHSRATYSRTCLQLDRPSRRVRTISTCQDHLDVSGPSWRVSVDRCLRGSRDFCV